MIFDGGGFRLVVGSATELTGGRRSNQPTFHAVALKLHEDQLAKLIWQGKGRKSRLGAAPAVLWGIELRDIEAELSGEGRDEMSATLSQVLLPYQLTVPDYVAKSKAMSPAEREKAFSYKDAKKFMCMPPPAPVLQAVPLQMNATWPWRAARRQRAARRGACRMAGQCASLISHHPTTVALHQGAG